jgi:tetratricopeptide (TPR) repeat protein
VDLANEAITLARDNGLEYWATDGIIRLGTAYFASGDYAHAESYFQQALELAQKSERPRLVALAELNLATLRDQQGRPDDVISFAQKAFAYYQPTRFFDESTDALILIARAKLEQAQFREALQRGRDALALTVKAGNPVLVGLAEEVTGDAFLRLQNYREALVHYQSALKSNPNEYNMLHCADAFWRLGRYLEAEQMISGIPDDVRKRPDVKAEIESTEADMRLSQKRYWFGLGLAQSALRTAENRAPSSVTELEITAAIAESHLGHLKDAEARLQKIISASQSSDEVMANAQLALADVYFAEHLPQRAKPPAEAANAFFTSAGQSESECLSLLSLAKIQRALGDGVLAQKSATKALDILSEFEHNWSVSNRPDLQDAARELVAICRK